MIFIKHLILPTLFIQLIACSSEPATPEEVARNCAGLERNERERCLQHHMGSYDQQRREELMKQQ